MLRGVGQAIGALLTTFVASFLLAPPSWANPPDSGLQAIPANIYKVNDPGGSRTSSFAFNIAVICPKDCALTPIAARVELSRAGTPVERQIWTAEMLSKIKHVSYKITPDTPLASPIRLFTLPEAFDLGFYFRIPQALAVDFRECPGDRCG